MIDGSVDTAVLGSVVAGQLGLIAWITKRTLNLLALQVKTTQELTDALNANTRAIAELRQLVNGRKTLCPFTPSPAGSVDGAQK